MNKDLLLKLKELGQNFNILYVEDEEDIRNIMEPVLKEFFSTVYVANDGHDGLEIFESKSIDMVLTDIEMPVMSGLDMIEKIRELSSDIPICIISAFNDTQKFTRAIRYRVNRYLLKPIEQDSVIKTINDMLVELKNEIDAKEYQKKLQNEKLSKEVEKTAEYFLQSIPSPVFVVDLNRKIVYKNELINNMLLQKDIKVEIGDDINKLESMFLLKNNEQISFNEINKNIIYRDKKEQFIFRPLKQEIQISTIDGVGTIIILNDITNEIKYIRMIEYQKQKLQSNKEILEEFLSRNIFTVKKEEREEAQKVLEKSEFNENEALLRRTHIYKISATDYLTTLDDTIDDELEELNELELDLQSEIYEFEYSQKYESLEIISGIFKSYARTLIRLIEFSDLGDAVLAVASYIDELTQEHITSNAFMIKEVIQSIHDDLSNWKEIVFITQQTDDIHYLDSSLYSTIIELKNVFETSDDEDEEDDDDDELEFF